MAEQRLRPSETQLLRPLWRQPIQLNKDNTEEYEERGSTYFELFVDLVLVAAVSNIGAADLLLLLVQCWRPVSEPSLFSNAADGFKEEPNYVGFGNFLLLFMLTYTPWTTYAKFCTRFEDESLLHSSILLLYLMSAVSAAIHMEQLNYLRGFALSSMGQRMALCFMFATVSAQYPPSSRARNLANVFVAVLTAAAVVLAVAGTLAPPPPEDAPASAVALLVVASFMEPGSALLFLFCPGMQQSTFIKVGRCRGDNLPRRHRQRPCFLCRRCSA